MKSFLKKLMSTMVMVGLLSTSSISYAASHWNYFPIWQGNVWLYKYSDLNGNEKVTAVNINDTAYLADSDGYPLDYATSVSTGLLRDAINPLALSGYYGNEYSQNLLWAQYNGGAWQTLFDFNADQYSAAYQVSFNECLSYDVQAQALQHNVQVPTGSYHNVKSFEFFHRPEYSGACLNNHDYLFKKMSFAPTVGLISFATSQHNYSLVYANVYNDTNFTQSAVNTEITQTNGLRTTMILPSTHYLAGENKTISTSFLLRNTGTNMLALDFGTHTYVHTAWLEDVNGVVVAESYFYLPRIGFTTLLGADQIAQYLNVEIPLVDVAAGDYILKGKVLHQGAEILSMPVTVQ